MRCGVDTLVARLFAHVRGVVLPAQESLLVHGQLACWLEDGDELIPLRAPATGTVLTRNAALQSEAGLLAADPYGAGWLFDLAGDLSTTTAPTVCRAAAASAAALRQLARLERRATRALVQGRRRVGATAADGGEPLSDLRRILGAERYRRLIRPYVG
jgi:glycine cleavage system H lipoate-binding protein